MNTLMHKMLVDFLPYLIPLAISYASRFVVLTFALWMMVRMQELQHTVPGVIGSAVLASVFDMIPFVGHPLAAAVLLLCVMKMTRAHLIDIRFTVGISYALTFMIQMLVLSLLPTDLHVNARTATPTGSAMQEAAMADDETQADEDEALPVKTTNAVIAKASLIPAKATPVVAKELPSVAKAVPAPEIDTVPNAALDKAVTDLGKDLKLRGVVHNSRESMIMLGTGGKTYTIALGESINLKTPAGAIDLKVESVTSESAVVSMGGKLTSLTIR